MYGVCLFNQNAFYRYGRWKSKLHLRQYTIAEELIETIPGQTDSNTRTELTMIDDVKSAANLCAALEYVRATLINTKVF